VRPQAEEAKIVVLSEDDQSRQLLETRISKDDGNQKQQGTVRKARDTGANAD
jgi:protein phosphatase-4 regulatory subunit 3